MEILFKGTISFAMRNSGQNKNFLKFPHKNASNHKGLTSVKPDNKPRCDKIIPQNLNIGKLGEMKLLTVLERPYLDRSTIQKKMPNSPKLWSTHSVIISLSKASFIDAMTRLRNIPEKAPLLAIIIQTKTCNPKDVTNCGPDVRISSCRKSQNGCIQANRSIYQTEIFSKVNVGSFILPIELSSNDPLIQWSPYVNFRNESPQYPLVLCAEIE
jgi:hypothetical protein